MALRDFLLLACCGVVAWFLWSYGRSLGRSMRIYLVFLRRANPLAFADLKRQGLPRSAWVHLLTAGERRLRNDALSRHAWTLRVMIAACPLVAMFMLGVAWKTLGGG